MEMKLELVPVPVSDVERAKAFYAEQAGFSVDVDQRPSDEIRFVQLTPPGSRCSIAIGSGLDLSQPGAVKGLLLVVPDIEAARADLVSRGVEVSEIRDEQWGSRHAYFAEPDGNSWQLQQPR